LKPTKITVKAVCDRRATTSGEGHQVCVHAKTTLTAILARFDPAPVGGMAKSGLSPPGTAGKCSNRYGRDCHQPSPTGLTCAKPGLNQLTALMKTRLERMQYRPGVLDGFPAKTGLDLTPPVTVTLTIEAFICVYTIS
jgi:hypothetical protein